MDVTLVLVGGYWGASKKLYKPVDPDMDKESRGVDYLLRVKGLPEEFLPAEKRKVVKYICTQCEKPVPEWEVENKIGCFQMHKCKQEITFVDEYPGYIYAPVNPDLAKKKKFLKDGIVIWISNPEGYKTAERIFNYIQKRLPATEVMPSPVAAGVKSGWTIDSEEDIPLIDITTFETKQEVANKKNMQICPHCGAEVGIDPRALRMHIMQRHKDIFSQLYPGKEEKAATPSKE